MKLLLLNPAHPAIGSRIPREHLPPLGLLALGGPLIDAGYRVELLDADRLNLSVQDTVRRIAAAAPDAVLLGHSGSTSAHPVVVELTRAIRGALPQAWLVYGGVYPTYHYREIMHSEPQIDFIVRGEGERTIVGLAEALENASPLDRVTGIVYRPGTIPHRCRFLIQSSSHGTLQVTPPTPLITDLDSCRIAWELIDHRDYSYWGNRRAVVVQLSRGCPHLCNYCGQRVFWNTWRHRDPVRLAAELARLHREEGVEVINFADENPTASRLVWRQFLEALIRENVPLILVGSTRAGDIVRDEDILHLYKKAGVARFLMGIESTDERTLQKIRKGSSQTIDRKAIQLLRRHGIISMAACVAGFARETDADYWRLLRQITSYDPDQVQLLYATPHSWTGFAHTEKERTVVQTDLRLWDYKHQVLESERVPNWRLLLWVKFIEAVAQLRPKSLARLLFHPDRGFRQAMRWYYRIGACVWPYELRRWFCQEKRVCTGPKLKEFLSLEPLGHKARPSVDPFPVARIDISRKDLLTRRHETAVIPS
jgi:anaerobic magnesium-protoporphyrin IX monomethyl ester cyclase